MNSLMNCKHDDDYAAESDDDDGEADSLCSYEYESEFEYEDESTTPALDPEKESTHTAFENGPECLARKSKRTKSDTEESFDLARQGPNIACDLRHAAKLMNRMVGETASVLFVSRGAAHLLLRHFKWDQVVLNDKYFGQEERVWRECGVSCGREAGAESAASKARLLQTVKSSEKEECGICFEDEHAPDRMYSMSCRHAFCRICWKTYLETAINTEGPRCLCTTCPEPRCGQVITEDDVSELAPTAVEKFVQYQLRSFVETNKKVRWCPGPSCEQIAVANNSEGFEGEMTCRCGTAFCLECGEASHAPLLCRTLAEWSQKCMDESENANWILVNTKECPECHVRIEKNQGCNHMSCSKCNYEFCWICMADWKSHSSCNRFDKKKLKKGQSDISRAKADLERYLHCYNRFHSHSVGQTFSEDQLRSFVKSKEEGSEEDSVEKPEDRAFTNALRQLIECRRVLKYSYAVSYFMADSSTKKDLFEDQQKLLESFTERLSELTESKKREEKELMNMTGAVSHFVSNVLSGGPY